MSQKREKFFNEQLKPDIRTTSIAKLRFCLFLLFSIHHFLILFVIFYVISVCIYGHLLPPCSPFNG